MDGSILETQVSATGVRPTGPNADYAAVYAELLRLAKHMLLKVVGYDAMMDIAHNIGLALWRRFSDSSGGFKPPDKLEAYLRKCLRAGLATYLEQRTVREPHEYVFENARELAVLEWMDPDAGVCVRDLEAEYLSILNRFGEECREIYLRVREDGLSYAEVAAERGIGLDAVKYHLKRAHRALGSLEVKYGKVRT